MRVLQVVTDTDRRGAQVFATRLGPALVALGHDVHTVALAPGSVGGLPVSALGVRPRSLPTLRRLRAAARRADVVVAHGSHTLLASAVATVGGPPFVYRQISDSLVWAGTPARRARVRALLSRAASVVALGDRQAEVLHRSFGVPTPRLSVIPNGVPAEAFAPASPDERTALRRRFGLGVTGPVAAVVGALAPEKGVDVALDALGRLPGVELLVAGSGPDEGALREAARPLGDRVRFVGRLDDPRSAYAAADVVLLPSRTESLPAVPIEAAFCSVPTVASRVGAVDEIVVDGVTGSLVDPADPEALASAVAALLDEPDAAAARGAAARQHCLERFDIPVVAERWDRVLRATT